jgi:hypothetical protein
MRKPKSSRVSVIKNNIEKGSRIPNAKNDCTIGQWADQELTNKGHKTDKTGVVDLPEYKIDNKTRKKGSKANHTVGSWLTSNIKNTPIYENTPFYHKAKNQNQIEWDPDFMEVSKVKIVDMEIPAIQDKLKEGYEDCQAQVVAGNTAKEIKSKNGWVVLDGYNNTKSYRMRITDKAMKQIHNISGSRDTFQKHFEEETV